MQQVCQHRKKAHHIGDTVLFRSRDVRDFLELPAGLTEFARVLEQGGNNIGSPIAASQVPCGRLGQPAGTAANIDQIMLWLQTGFDENLEHELAELVEVSAHGFRHRGFGRLLP